MEPFVTLTSTILPLPRADIDTDQIIPAAFLKVTDKNGLAEGLFQRWRYSAENRPDPDFPLNQPAYQGAQVLLSGDNFGCGSSREHAPWALMAWGFRAVISTGFADIFRNNALKNGLLPVELDTAAHQRLLSLVSADPAALVTIDLAAQTVQFPDGSQERFPIDGFNKACLLQGVDSLGYLLAHEPQILAYEQSRIPYA